jgi:uncharacterized membrane protein
MASSPTPAPAASSGMTNNMVGALCYLCGWITGVIFLVIEPYKNDKTVRFHAFQSIFFNLSLIPLYVALIVFGIVLGVIHLGFLMIPIWLVIALAVFGAWILLMVKAYNNETFKLPVIGDFAAKQAGL